MAMKTRVVGRSEQSDALRRVLLGQTRGNGPLTIQSIEGPGGIGKTTLLDHVRAGTPLSDRRYLRLSLRGEGAGDTSAARALVALVKSASIEGLADSSLPSRFPEVQRVSAELDRLIREGTDILSREDAFAGLDPKVLLRLFDATVAAGKPLNRTIKISRNYVDFDEIERFRPELEQALNVLAPFLAEAPSFIDRLRPGGHFALRNALRTNALEPLAAALEQDLRTVLDAQAPWTDMLKPKQSGHGKVERLLLEIDDYETTCTPVGRLLLDHLLPKLAQAPFESLVVVLGRDQLVNTDPGWAQHFGRNLCEPIVLDTLTRPEVDELCDLHGVQSAEDRDRVWKDTQGYPLQVELWLDELRQSGGQPSGGPSATTLKRFHDRTTRWMSERERRWLDCFLFLEAIDKRTARAMLDDPQDVDAAVAWFQNEGSVRDPAAAFFTIRAFARSRLMGYLKLTDPDRHEVLQQRATGLGSSQ